MRKFFYFFLINYLCFLNFFGCASSFLNLQTQPEAAQVYASVVGGKEPKNLGKTPLLMRSKDVYQRLEGGGPFFLEFRKEGYLSESVLVTGLQSADLKIVLDLKKSNDFDNLEKINFAVDVLFESQRLVRAHRYDEALKRLDALKKESPQFSAIYELEGAIYYLSKKYNESLDSYRIALKINSNNLGAKRMERMIESALKGKRN